MPKDLDESMRLGEDREMGDVWVLCLQVSFWDDFFYGLVLVLQLWQASVLSWVSTQPFGFESKFGLYILDCCFVKLDFVWEHNLGRLFG